LLAVHLNDLSLASVLGHFTQINNAPEKHGNACLGFFKLWTSRKVKLTVKADFCKIASNENLCRVSHTNNSRLALVTRAKMHTEKCLSLFKQVIGS